MYVHVYTMKYCKLLTHKPNNYVPTRVVRIAFHAYLIVIIIVVNNDMNK